MGGEKVERWENEEWRNQGESIQDKKIEIKSLVDIKNTAPLIINNKINEANWIYLKILNK